MIVTNNHLIADNLKGYQKRQQFTLTRLMPTTILLVENNDFLRRTLRWWLTMKFPYCRIIEVANEVEALLVVETYVPHIAIIDMTYPNRSRKIIAQLKTISPELKIIALTFREDEINYADSLSDDVSVYISHEKIQTTLHPALSKLLSVCQETEG